MSVKDDPALYSSNFERNENDRYWTGEAEASAIARRIPSGIGTVWEPAAGRGDLAKVIQGFGYDVFASDIDISEFNANCELEQCDFLGDGTPSFFIDQQIDAIITNSPFGKKAEAFVRKALTYENVRYMAFLLRSEWKHGSKRLDLFQPGSHYAKEIVLTWRPRWDWWFRDKAESSPRHNFSWFCWDREHVGEPTQTFATRTK